MWRSAEHLPDELVFRVNYLGGDMPTFTLNFSRPGNQVVGQYYNFLRLGREGYTKVMQSLSSTARWLGEQLAEADHCELVSDGSAIPVVSFRLAKDRGYTEFDVSHELRGYGWQVPAYTMPDNATHISVLRIVVREGLSADLARALHDDARTALASLDKLKPGGHYDAAHFAHYAGRPCHMHHNGLCRRDARVSAGTEIRVTPAAKATKVTSGTAPNRRAQRFWENVGSEPTHRSGSTTSLAVTPISLTPGVLAEAVVDLGAIAHNVRVLREHAGGARVMAVVKADGYGHGATRVARTALAAGAAKLGVATVDEALALRADGITAPVLAWLHRPASTSGRRCWPMWRSPCPRCASSTRCWTRCVAPGERRP